MSNETGEEFILKQRYASLIYRLREHHKTYSPWFTLGQMIDFERILTEFGEVPTSRKTDTAPLEKRSLSEVRHSDVDKKDK